MSGKQGRENEDDTGCLCHVACPCHSLFLPLFLRWILETWHDRADFADLGPI